MPAPPDLTRGRRGSAASTLRWRSLLDEAASLGVPAAAEGDPLSAAVAGLSDRCLALLDAGTSGEPERLAQLVADLQELFVAVRGQELAERDVRLAQCERGLGRLRDSASTADLLDRLCREVARSCGFARVLLSRVEGGHWQPWLVGAADADDPWSRLVETGPIPLQPGSPEGEVVAGRRPRLVPEAAAVDIRWAGTGTTSFVVAGIGPAGRVIGLLHGDHGSGGPPCDLTDRDVLGRFAQGFGHRYERTSLLESMRVQQGHLRDLLSVLESTTERLTESEIELTAALGADPATPLVPVGGGLSAARLASLTPRERQVLELVAGGARNAEISERLVLSEGTVKTHVKHILAKLGASNRSQAIAQYLGREDS